jgi:Nif-specific regulatory protein
MAHLVVREPGRVTFTIELGDRMDIGRGADNDLVIGDRQASRKHARIERTGDGWRVTDLASTHGVLVNQALCPQHDLADGDTIQIGGTVLGFRGRTEPLDVVTSVASTPADPEQRLRVLFDVSRIIGAQSEPEELVGRMLDATLAVLGCARGVAGLADGGSVSGRRVVRPRGEDVVVSRALIEAMLARREAVLVAGPKHGTLARQGVAAAMGAPLVAGGRVLGFLYVDDRTRANRFSADELDFLSALAHLTAAALAQAEAHRRAVSVAAALRDAHPTDELLGASAPITALRARIHKYAAAPGASVLIRGESGTGKELVAALIHALSARADEPFVAVNCAAIPETLIESELFGHDKGAFTGAARARRGKFVLAHRGTLFLDEVGDLSLAAQAKVLRALQEREIVPVGAEEAIGVDVRVLSATHKHLEAEIAAGRFREDLYYRLNLGEIEVPPLRDRGDDVVLLARAFIERSARRLGRPAPALADPAVEVLRRYRWPGNVRQLQNEIERALILGEGTIDLDELRARVDGAAAPAAGEPLVGAWQRVQRQRAALDATEREVIGAALRAHGGVVARAARDLGVPRTTLVSRIQSLGVEPA